MKGKFSLSAADAAFIRSAPLVITHRIESEATCESLWQTLTSDGALTSWAHGITGATGPRTDHSASGLREPCEPALLLH